MDKDMTVPCGNGILNIRVGAIIMREGQILMVGNRRRPEYLYSVGGRIRFGETAEEAVVREVYEETGVRLEVDRLGFVHENYFYGDAPDKAGKLTYEISFFFYMKTPKAFAPVCRSLTEDGQEEYLCWIAPDAPVRYYPDFFRTELLSPGGGVRHFLTDGRLADDDPSGPLDRRAK